MQNTWSKGTLERPVLFQPNYVVAPPDYEAIKEDGSTKYYNTGLTGSYLRAGKVRSHRNCARGYGHRGIHSITLILFASHKLYS